MSLASYFSVSVKPAHAVMQSPRVAYASLPPVQLFITISQNPSQLAPHAPAPPGPAWTQWVVGSPAATPAWYARHSSELPVMSPIVPCGNAAHAATQVAWLPYWT